MANALYSPGPGTLAPYCGFPISPRPPSGPSSQYSTHPAHAFFIPPSKLSTCYNYLSISLTLFSTESLQFTAQCKFSFFPFCHIPFQLAFLLSKSNFSWFSLLLFHLSCLSSLLPLQISPFPLSKAGHGHVRPHRAFSLHHELHPLLLTTPRPTSHIHPPVNTSVNQSTACSYSIP